MDMKKLTEFDLNGSFQQFSDIMIKRCVDRIDIYKGRMNLDFNAKNDSAFYVTKYRKQAKLWAIRRATDDPYSSSVIAQFKVNFNECKSKYNVRTFTSYYDWKEFVINARDGKVQHNFDAIEGPCYANPADPDIPPFPLGHQIAIKSRKLIANEFEYKGYVSPF